jgi:hypothetical protein
VQQDPYQQFASPYIALGGDPVNMVDPSGGWSTLANGLAKGLGMTRLGVAALTTLAGALIGNAAYGAAGGQGAKGLIVGAFLGLASNFSGSIGGAVVQAVVGTGKILANNAVAMPTVAPPQATISNVGVTVTNTTTQPQTNANSGASNNGATYANNNEDPNLARGDKLCPNSFNFKEGNDRSFFSTDMKGLKFESDKSTNTFNASFALTNGITDDAMNKELPPDNAYGKEETTPLDALKYFFKDLIKNGDIASKKVGNKTYWYFNKYAAQHIAASCANIAAMSIAFELQFTAAIPGNKVAASMFVNRTAALLKCFMPGSTVSLFSLGKTFMSIAIYSLFCGK